ncbi:MULTISPECIES: secretin N-terminal domain-containing protein [unclassified Janthinobacterium]|uniref:secretin N-terminal domain-containing protein n=1 Tax=unclassified Janthinobacterium TaxID=2610881 RepID=UPI000884C973|nr:MULTISPECIES: secretin N-terminal domain-containing protein [unclassified Janthinobacterium]SDA74224.1 general secretion pathway protein D [Janthinobacterium sp. 551a]SFB58973.1 general secretion pathway protein D [Janthinobacterium sp. 344]
MNQQPIPVLASRLALACSAMLAGCASHQMPLSPAHLNEAPRPAGAIPEPVQQSSVLPAPLPAAKAETYSVTVHKVPVQSLLFALARDAGMNVDIHPQIEGSVTLNALNQTLPQLLTRISKQVDMRYEIDGKNLLVLPDAPVWRNYKVDYVNMARSTNSSVNIATQISTAGAGSNSSANANAQGSSGNGNNNSTTLVVNRSENNFWYSLERNIRDLLRETTLNDAQVDPLAQLNQQLTAAQGNAPGQQGQAGQQGQQQNPGGNAPPPTQNGGQYGNQYGSQAPMQTGGQLAPGQQQGNANPAQPVDANGLPLLKLANKGSPSSVVVNVEGGLIAVRATGRQHEKIAEFIDTVLHSAKRQVLIEATIIEVRLSNEYQQGINWSRLTGNLQLRQQQVGTLPSGVTPGATPGIFVLNYLKDSFSTTIQLLESFGKVKVLSSPKISVLNNQTAMLKVVDNNVFFTIKVTPAVISSTGTITTPATYESKLETVPVGFVMSVTPQISDSDEVTLNVRPTITRIVGYEQDPNPALATANVRSRVPVIQARELESIMKVGNGQIAVMGGLMQDSIDNLKDGVPGLSSLPVVGNLFTYRSEANSKTELVIFMRPVVVKDAGIDGDFRDYRYLLPGQAPLNSQPYTEGPPAAAAPPQARVQGDFP